MFSDLLRCEVEVKVWLIGRLAVIGTVAVLASSVEVGAQFFVWARPAAGYQANSVAVDDSGNVYAVGEFTGTVDFDPGPDTVFLVSAGNDDIFVSKHDSMGNFIWAKQLGGEGADLAMDVAVDSVGNVYTVGSFTGIADFDPGLGSYELQSAGSNDAFISKLDSNGDFVWAGRFGGQYHHSAQGVAVDANDNIYTVGDFSGNGDFDPGLGEYILEGRGAVDVFISKLDSTGSFVWAAAILSVNAYVYAGDVALDSEGNVCTVGHFVGGHPDFDPGPGTFYLQAVGYRDLFVSKLDSAGNFLWAGQIGGPDAGGYALGVSVDASGAVYTVGVFVNTMDFDPGTGTQDLISEGMWDAFILKLSSAGDLTWAGRLGGSDYDRAEAVAVDDSGDVYTVGNFFGEVDFNPGLGTHNMNCTAGYCGYFLKLNSAGDFLWAGQIAGAGTSQSVKDVTVDADNFVYPVGRFLGTVDFDPGPESFEMTGNEAYIMKLGPSNIDADSDGSSIGYDCDDFDPHSYPGATELCDGNDNTCAGSVPSDEVDNDGDNYVECAAWNDVQGDDPTILGGGDCDDTSVSTFPGAAPNDSATSCMRDSDSDGWGDYDPPPGVTAGTDCKDTNSLLHPNNDYDADGLGDCEELLGIDVDSDGIDDLGIERNGADPLVPDVFVEIDYMSCEAGVFSGEPNQALCDGIHVPHFPNADALTLVEEAFERHGARLHVSYDLFLAERVPEKEISSPDDIYRYQWGVYRGTGYPDYSPDSICDNPDDAYFGTAAERCATPENGCSDDRDRCLAIMTARSRFYRYALFVHKIAGMQNGIAFPGCGHMIFAVADAQIWRSASAAARLHGTSTGEEHFYYEAGTFMHELGHTLGLDHAGLDESPRCKPNYLSIMNHARVHNVRAAASGLSDADDGDPVRFATLDDDEQMARWLDYSDAELDLLNESSGLHEPNGVGHSVCSVHQETECDNDGQCPPGESCIRLPSNHRTVYCGRVTGTNCRERLMGPTGVPIDWDGDGIIEEELVQGEDINLINDSEQGVGCNGAGSSLEGYDDWKRILGDTDAGVAGCITFPGVSRGAGRLALGWPDAFPTEPTAEQYLNAVLGSSDADSDGVLNSEDHCPATYESAQADVDSDSYGDACDCLPADGNNWDTPSETRFLRFTDKYNMEWMLPWYLGSLGPVYDVLRSGTPSDFTSTVECVETNDGSDTHATDLGEPSLGQVYYYLIRAETACPEGLGPLGEDSVGVPRSGADCN